MSAPGRKISKRACDGCKVRKIKCSGIPPCPACVAAGVSCTFARDPLTRGPRTLRPRTVRQIAEAQQAAASERDVGSDSPPPRASAASTATATATTAGTPPNHATPGTQPVQSPSVHHPSTEHRPTPTYSLVLRLCVYRLRLFPVWPIIAVEEIMASLNRDPGDMESYALANAVGAATVAQLKLERTADDGDSVTADSMVAECQRVRRLLHENEDEPAMNINRLRTSFFLHVYHENKSPGGSRSLLYLREAITMAQLMGLHKQSSYVSLPARDQQMRQRVLCLLFVTERGVAMLHKLPVVLNCNIRSLNLDEAEDEARVLPAFKKLVNLFWLFDQSGAFNILQSSDDVHVPPDAGMEALNRACFELLQRQVREVSMESDKSNDVQAADICVTRQWMQAVLWRASLARGQATDSSQQATSLSHPIQIAREFLEVISRLPASAVEAHGAAMEYKIYEIARAVTDAVANGILLPRNSSLSDRASDILNQLQRKLASCRGGNKTLLSLLRARIAEVQAGATSATYTRPETQVEHAEGDELLQQVHGVSEIGEYPSFQARLRSVEAASRSWQSRPGQQAQQHRRPQLHEQQQALPRIPVETQRSRPMQQGTLWDQGVPEDLALSTHDLFNQLQTFDGSFNDAETAGAIDLVLTNSILWDDWEVSSGAPPQDSSIFNYL